MKTTKYFDADVALNHPESVTYREYVEKSLTECDSIKDQPNGRICRWILVPEAAKYLRVVIESDGETIHNAFFDSGYTRKKRREEKV